MTDETIFAAAVEQPSPAERAAFLDTACGAETAQRKRIEALLAAHDKAGKFLERPAVALPEPDRAATRAYAAPGDALTGTHGGVTEDDEKDALGFLEPPGRPDSLGRIGHYEVLEVLGHGGFGIVYRAFDDVLQRVVAVKVLAPSLATTSPARKRFLREARAAGAVQHENIVRIHAIEEHPLPHLVMEFIPGETLQQRLDRTGPIDVAEVVRVGRQVADGLSAAHANGLIHRDIKPSNILVDASPDARIKITDFGLARAADDASLTRSGTVAGTPMYMAPEQAKGEALDHRADLFSLGSVLYVMCSGRPPFRANSTLAVLKRVADEEPRPIREIIPEVPEWLCRIVEKLHAKDPAERFQTAKEVADVLADCEKQLVVHKEVKDTSRIPEGKVAPARCGEAVTWKSVAFSLLSLLVLWAWLGQFVALYATDRGMIRFSTEADPDLQQLLVRRDGEVVATLDRANSQAKLPPGDYEVEAVCIAGYEATKFTAETRRTMTVRGTFERVEGHPVIRLTLRRGDATTIAATTERRATIPPSPSAGPEVKGWGTAVDPERDCRFEAGADGLTITVPGGKHNLNPTPAFNNLTAPRVLRNAEGDFQLETRVESFPSSDGSQYDYVGAGLLLWQDAKNFVRFTRSARGESRQPYIHFECFRDGRQTVSTGLDLTSRPTMLRAVRTGGVFRFHWSADGTTWREYPVESPIHLADKLAVGVCAINTTPLPFVAKFSHSQSRPGTDVWVPLFNGTDLTGWTPSPNSPGQWRVEGGELVGTHGPGYLFGTKSYENFHLRAEAKINAGGNSGIAFRRAFQVEIFDDPECPTGTLLQVAPGKTTPLAHYPNPTRVDAWITLEIRADGPTLAVRVGEGPWVTSQDSRAEGTRSGPLQLEVFGPNTVVQFRKIEIKELPASLPAHSGPTGAVLLKALDPAKDKAMPFGANISVRVEDGAWRIEDTSRPEALGNFLVALGGTITDEIPADGVIIYRAKVRLQPKEEITRGELRLNNTTPSFHKYDWPEYLGEFRGELTEWTEKVLRFPAEVFHKKNPPTITMQISLVGKGVLWIKDVELIHMPAAKPSAPKPVQKKSDGSAKPVLLKALDPTKDKAVPLRGDASKIVRVEDGAWRIENNNNGGNFRVALTTLIEDIPEDGILIFRAKVKLEPKHKDAWGDLELTNASPSFYNYDWPGHLGEYRGEIKEWTEKEVRYPAEVFHKKKLPAIPVYVGLHADGVLWIKDAELLHIPAPPKPPEKPTPPAPPLAAAPFDAAKAKEHQEAWAKHLGVDVEVTNSIGMKLRLIPPGSAPMGSTPEAVEAAIKATGREEWAHNEIRGEAPSSTTSIDTPFYMGVHEVTREQFERFVAETKYVTEAEASGKGGLAWDENTGQDERKREYTWKNATYVPSQQHPVVFVTPADARAFCDWLTRKDGRRYTLPSEAQWEFACRGGTATPWYSGAEPGGLDDYEWIKTNSDDRSHAVGSKKPNSFGLFDMLGNVSEVAFDTTGKPVHRGGTTAFSAWLSRSASRYRIGEASYSHARGGFRVVVVGDLKASPAKANPAVLQPLRDEVAAKTRTVETTKTRYEVGVASKIDVLNAEAELTDSRVALAEAEGDAKAVVARLEELVKQRQEERDLIAVRVNFGADRPDVLDRADTRLANAKVRLAKVKP